MNNNNNQQLNPQISTIFDNVMSESAQREHMPIVSSVPVGATSLDALRRQAQNDNIQHQNHQQLHKQHQQHQQQNQQQNQHKHNNQHNSPKQIVHMGRKHINKPKVQAKGQPKSQPKVQPKTQPKAQAKAQLKNNNIQSDLQKMQMFDISKKAMLGAVLYLLLSIPQFTSVLDKMFPSKSDTDIYKSLLLRAILFSILFVLSSKYV